MSESRVGEGPSLFEVNRRLERMERETGSQLRNVQAAIDDRFRDLHVLVEKQSAVYQRRDVALLEHKLLDERIVELEHDHDDEQAGRRGVRNTVIAGAAITFLSLVGNGLLLLLPHH